MAIPNIIMKYLVLFVFLLIIIFDIWVYRNGKKNQKKELSYREPPVFDENKNHIPVYDHYNICNSDFLESGSLLQIHYSVMQNDEVIRGFCTRDLIPFEQKVRAKIRLIFEQLGDKQTDRTIKMWYRNMDGSDFSDTCDIPLNIVITFYKPLSIDNGILELLKRQIYQCLCELMEIDWKEVNTILKNCYDQQHRLLSTLQKLSDFDLDGDTVEISDSSQNVCRHLYRDMIFFYENQWFYGGGNAGTVYENLKKKYKEVDDCYLQYLSQEYAKDTMW